LEIKYTESENNSVIIYPIGSFEMEDTNFFEQKVTEVLEKTGRNKVIFNMSELNYLNSTALNQFIGIYNRLLKSGYSIIFCALTRPVETLFNITSLKLLIPIYKSEWDALNSLK